MIFQHICGTSTGWETRSCDGGQYRGNYLNKHGDPIEIAGIISLSHLLHIVISNALVRETPTKRSVKMMSRVDRTLFSI